MLFIDIKEVEGAFIVIPKRYHDGRGFFQEGYNSKTYENKVDACHQISFSKSKILTSWILSIMYSISLFI